MIYTPSSLDEALALMAQGDRRPLAGATDYMVARKRGKTPPCDLVSLDSIDELRSIIAEPQGLTIGAMTTFSALEKDSHIPACLREAAALVGGPQIRNRATIGGNICTASPAADSVPAFSVLDAKVILRSVKSCRELDLYSFMVSAGKTCIEQDELLTAIVLPLRVGKTAFYKLGKRNSLSISIVNMALRIEINQDRIAAVAIAVGSVAPSVFRARKTEAFLLGNLAHIRLFQEAAEILSGETAPISDIRASAEYRRKATQSILIDMLTRLAGAQETGNG